MGLGSAATKSIWQKLWGHMRGTPKATRLDAAGKLKQRKLDRNALEANPTNAARMLELDDEIAELAGLSNAPGFFGNAGQKMWNAAGFAGVATTPLYLGPFVGFDPLGIMGPGADEFPLGEDMDELALASMMSGGGGGGGAESLGDLRRMNQQLEAARRQATHQADRNRPRISPEVMALLSGYEDAIGQSANTQRDLMSFYASKGLL